jgi:hypothetical protein
LTSRRAELLAEVFFQELDPVFISRPTQDVGYDLLVGFRNEKAGINTFAVEVKATERPPGSRFPLPRKVFNRIVHSNVPGLLVVADVKKNQLYYAWLRSSDGEGNATTISVRVVEINDATKNELLGQFRRADARVAAAG